MVHLCSKSRVGPGIAVLGVVAMMLCAGSAFATPIGTDITVYDNQAGSGLYSGSTDTRSGVLEDQETEPGTVTVATEPRWDLEAVFLDSSGLALMGQFPFNVGLGGYGSGDIFLDINPVFSPSGNPNDPRQSNPDGSGYDYVIDITATNNYNGDLTAGYTYTVYSIAGLTVGSGLLGVSGGPDTDPNPFRYVSGGTQVATGSFTLTQYTTAALNPYLGGTGFQGTTDHYILDGFNLAFLGSPSQLFVHYTMECGNDLLTGYTTNVPPPPPVAEPASLLVIGVGLAGAALAKRGSKLLAA